MVTHDSRILDVADRIVNMIDGRIVSDVPVHETVTVCAFLKACPAFAGLTPSDLTDVAQKMTSQRVAAGEAVVREGEPGETFYLIRHGTFDVLRRKDGRLERVDGMGTGEFFGEAALLTGQPRNATVVATSDGQLLTLTREQFHTAIERAASFKDQLLTVFAQRNPLRE
jgi:putative ABC transport system ATP-binding protein